MRREPRRDDALDRPYGSPELSCGPVGPVGPVCPLAVRLELVVQAKRPAAFHFRGIASPDGTVAKGTLYRPRWQDPDGWRICCG
jgi:hypothetical protein